MRTVFLLSVMLIIVSVENTFNAPPYPDATVEALTQLLAIALLVFLVMDIVELIKRL